MPVNESEFPLMMSMLISPDITVPPPNLSVLGNFCLLHGISLDSPFWGIVFEIIYLVFEAEMLETLVWMMIFIVEIGNCVVCRWLLK